MKHTLFIGLALCALSLASCKNNKSAKEAVQAQPSQEVINAAKVTLADDALAAIDSIAQEYVTLSEKFSFANYLSYKLTDEEKSVKPDYLLDPKETENLMTKFQKTAAWLILGVESNIRRVYGMPMEESEHAMAKLSAELNIPCEYQEPKENKKEYVSSYIRDIYEAYKQRGELDYFCKMAYILQLESFYLVANNPEPFFRNVTDESWEAHYDRASGVIEAVKILSKFDNEVATFLKTIMPQDVDEATAIAQMEAADAKAKEDCKIKDGAKRYLIENKNLFANTRSALLK